MVNNTMVVDSTSEKRKVNKPLIEKKRRARINNCLMQLKKLVLEATGRNSESAVHSKLEKADILEMTVQHLERLQKRQPHRRTATTASTSTSYQNGYAACTNEAIRYLDLNHQLQDQARHSQHLGSACCQTLPHQWQDTQYINPGHSNCNYSNCVPVSTLSANHCYDNTTMVSSNSLPIYSSSQDNDLKLQTLNLNCSGSVHSLSQNETSVSNEQINNRQELNNQNNNTVWRPW